MSPKIRSFGSRILFNSRVDRIINRYLFLLLLIPLFFIAYPLIQPGISITGDFPYLDTGHYAANRLWMWVERGSTDGFDFASRIPIIGLFYLLSFVGVSSELATKAMVLSGFLLSSFSFYFSFLLFFKSRSTDSNIYLKIAAIVGSLLYAYNAWSFDRIPHWGLWIGYSLFPLFFVSTFFSFKYPKKWKYILISIFLWYIASMSPHMILFYGIVFVCIFLGFVINYWNKRKNPITVMIPMILIISFYFMVNIYWIYPYILASQIRLPDLPYEVTRESLELLSRQSDLSNTFRIMAYWLNTEVDKPDHQLLYYLWLFSSFAIPVIAFSALFLKKTLKLTLALSSAALVAIFLTMGTQSPLDYYKFALNFPILSKLVWLFRDPDKWSFFIVFAYSFLIGIVSYTVLSFAREKNVKQKLMITGFFLFLLIGSICLSSYPFYKARLDPLKPVLLPTEFDRLNAYLSTIKTDKIYSIPYDLKETEWDRSGTVQNIYQFHSIKPNIESSEYLPVPSTYYNYLVSSIMENRSKNIANMINPLGTSYVIFHNDTWSKSLDSYDPNYIDLLKKLYSLADLKNIANIGFYKIFKTGNNNNDVVGQVNIPYRSIAVLGGLDIVASLNVIPSFSSLQSSLLFLDNIHSKNTITSMKGFDGLLLDRPWSDDEFALSLVDDKYIITPFEATNSNDPSNVWSKSRATDPVHAEFHPELKKLGITNWDFDYGKGLVMTKAAGDKLTVPIEIQNNESSDGKDNNFYLFMRYLKNQKGGPLKVYVDDKLVNEIDTFDKISNNFIWGKVGSLNLTKGKHTLTLENIVGFNAVNIFAIIPRDEMHTLMRESARILENKTRAIYLLEAESNFYNNKGKESGTFIDLSEENSSNVFVNEDNKSTFTKKFKGQFRVPTNTDLVAFQFLANKNPNSNSSYSVTDLDFVPAYDKYNVFSSDFERKKGSVPLTTLGYSKWTNYDKDVQSKSLETNKPIYGNNSLKVDLKASDKPGSNRLATTFIPISDEAYYNATLDISAKDVKQLQSRILYYDANKEEMEQRDSIFEGKDGTFQDTFSSILLPPKEAKYLKYQILTKSANPRASSYLLDNVKLDEIRINSITPLENNSVDYLDQDQEENLMSVKKGDSLEIQLNNPNSTNDVIETKSFPVKENHIYNYSMTAEAKNVHSLSGIALFKSSSDIVENSTIYGSNASNGRVLSLSPGSEINTKLEILKPSNYTIAIRAKTCETCTFLRMDLERDDYSKNVNRSNKTINISLKDKTAELKWLYSNTTSLSNGTYELKIYSDSKTDLDSVVLYSNGNVNTSVDTNKENNKLFKDLFGLGENSSAPAEISGYKKINPTKYILDIKNATRPYMVAFAESYNPLWIAYSENINSNKSGVTKKSNDIKVNSVPLYGVTNGFYVNKTGDYTLIIEYEPQKWFTDGAIISIFTPVAILIGLFVLIKRKTVTKNYFAIIKRIRSPTENK